MNILFLLKSLGIGGVEVVTATLANKFVVEGHNVSIFAREHREKTIQNRLNSRVKVFEGVGDNDCNQNVNRLHDIYVTEDIDIVINQWGLPFKPVRLANKAKLGHEVKIISFHHNDPHTNGKLQAVELSIARTSNPIHRFFLKFQYKAYNIITSWSMHYTYMHSDRFMVLSQSYLYNLQKFINVPKENKQGVLTNPITIDESGFRYNENEKEKEIIFCGRIDQNQKRASRLVDVWKILENRFHDWRLTIVGDGIMRESLEQKVRELGLGRVSFEGFQDPKEYYKRASILMLVSEYEGFPLVLAEAMSFGVVPIVYFSFSAAADIINDGENGILVDKPSDGIFPTEVFAEEMASLMSDENKLQKMQLGAIEKSKEYSLDNIYTQWENVLNELVSK